ncbi:MAG TPA: class I SAM-dependent methyltransferase [Rhodanobacteraceae bacterium]|nr:class I SAM-dependent methyltransferase [Rhodanobacteraceae bacterium]
MNTPSSAPPDLYSHYTEWKQWSGAFAVGDKEARYFAAELRDIPLQGRRVLEIGFGNGVFLAWARAQGARVSGIEINAAMLEAAHQHGFEAFKASLAELAGRGERYDVIAAFDVLEHWDAEELLRNFGLIQRLLRDDSIFVARFPNGQSPFGRVFQHGDLSHKSALSTWNVQYLAAANGLEVVRVSNACRVAAHDNPLSAMKQRWLAWRRRRIERRLSRLYGMPRLPLDPNLVAVLRKPRQETPPSNSTHNG